jgi:N-acetylneuraminic acid mutarotase
MGLGTVTTNNGKIYAIGGTDSTGTPLGVVEEYDIASNTWTTKASMPTPRFDFGIAITADDHIYVIGGSSTSITDVVEEYDPATDTWTTKAPMTYARMGVEVVETNNGKIYAIGGGFYCGENPYCEEVEEYDIASNTWTTKADMPIGTGFGSGAILANDKIYIIGVPPAQPVQVQEYDPVADSWAIKSTMPSRRWYTGTTMGPDGYIYKIGGYEDHSPSDSFHGDVNTVEHYDPLTDTWHTDTPLPTSRYDLSATTDSNGNIYAIGGVMYNSTLETYTFLNTVEKATPNIRPMVDAGGPYQVNEGGSVQVSATGNDPENGSLTYAWDLDNNGSFETLGQSVNFSAASLDGPSSHTIAVQVTDDGNLTATDQATVNVLNVAPTVGAITTTVDPVQVNTPINANASFTDPGTPDTHTAVWDWGDGTTTGTVTESNGSGSVSDSHTYTAAGVYTVKLTVTDDDNDFGESIFQYVVVYDPSAGYVTGAGTITSPLGAYTLNPLLTGKAIFGFVSRYQNGANVPTGQTQFRFATAQFTFNSTSYDWLVVGGPKAQYKGSGTINGSGDYGFMLTSIDGQINGGGGTDKFRIKIYDKITNVVIYDNQIGASDTSDPTTVIDSGSIMIHH